MRLTDAVTEFLLDQTARGNSAKTIEWYGFTLKAMCEQLDGDLETVSSHQIRAYLVNLRQTMAAASVASYATALFGFWRWASTEYSIANPCANVRRPAAPEPQPQAAKIEDIVKLFQATSNDIYGIRDRALIAFLMDTGARRGGAAGLTIDRLFVEDGAAIVTEKRKKTRRIHFTDFTARLLHAWLQERRAVTLKTDHVFVNVTTGAALSASGIWQIFKRLKVRAGVTGKVNPHAFRHHFAVSYMLDGGDVVTLGKLMGHRDAKTTMAYAVFGGGDLKAFHAQHTPMKKLRKQG